MKINNEAKKQILFYSNGASNYITEAIFEITNNETNLDIKKVMDLLIKANTEINILMKKTRAENE